MFFVFWLTLGKTRPPLQPRIPRNAPHHGATAVEFQLSDWRPRIRLVQTKDLPYLGKGTDAVEGQVCEIERAVET